jgi:hypothetical protein
MERTEQGVKGRDRNGNIFAIFYEQVCRVESRPFGCAIRLTTGEAIPLSMGRERAKIMFAKFD